MAYQYGTSPRKIEPDYDYGKTYKKDYETRGNRGKSKGSNKNNTTKNKNIKNNRKNTKRKLKPNVKAILYVVLGFSILFAISYRNSLITLTFNEKEALKTEVSAIQKENEQLKVGIEKSLNLNNVEQSAKELLGMQKLDNSQKKYISIQKQDYVESATEEVSIKNDEESDWFTNLLESIFGK